MSLWRWLNSVPKQKPSEQDLPNPNATNHPKEIADINSTVVNVMKAQAGSQKRGKYGIYDDEFRTKVARYAIVHKSDMAAVRKYSPELEKPLSESTVRTWRNLL